MFLSKITNWLKSILQEKTIIIPLVQNGVPTGQWVECKKGDETYIKMIKLYGYPLPKQIEVVPYKAE